MRITRRTFLGTLVASAAAATLGVTYRCLAEPHWLEISHTRVPLGRRGTAASPLRLAHLSDFHASPHVSLEFIAESVAAALAERPDVIALTGDFFTNRLRQPREYAAVLRRLSDHAPTFACLGNHDGGAWTQRAGGNSTPDEALALLDAAHIPCLDNSARRLTLRGRTLQFIGVGDLWSNMCDPATAFARAGERDDALRVVLNHNPDAKTLLHPFDWDLMLCGHTHGGQLRVPLLGTPFAPVADKRYVQGLHPWEKRWLYVTRGVGNLHGVRFNCRPEVSVLEIV